MLLAQNCLDVGGLTGCDLILICLYGFGVGSLTLIGGSLRGLAGGNYGGYSGVSLSLCGFSCGDNGKALWASRFACAALAAFRIAALSASAFAFAFLE